MALFSVKDVSFSSLQAEIVHDVSMEIEKGSIVELHGPSGGGKSTLLKLIAGILLPNEGSVCYNGSDLSLMTRSEDLQFRKECSFVFQDSALWANQTIAQNIMLPLQVHYPKLSAGERSAALAEVCEHVGYTRDVNVRPADLSAGEQKKVAIARALITKPKVLFLDECTASLDDQSSNVVIRLLHQYASEGNTIIYITHSERFRWEFQGILYEVIAGNVKEKAIDIDDLR